MKRIIIIVFHIVIVIIALPYLLVGINYSLSGHDNLDFGIERIYGITGYELDSEHAYLILHKTNACDSIVMVTDSRSTEKIVDQMERLVTTDARWTHVQIPEANAYDVISRFSNSYQTDQHFRPVCEINGGYYDYLFYETKHGDITGCIVDIDTGTIALYIYND